MVVKWHGFEALHVLNTVGVKLAGLQPERSAVRTKTLGVAIAALIVLTATGQNPAITQAQNKAAYPGKPLDAGGDAVRLFYLTHGETPQETQDLVHLIRGTTDIQRAYLYEGRRTIALRGSSDQIALAEWLFGRLDKPVDAQTVKPAAYEFPAPNGAVDAVRVLYFTQDQMSENPQHMINLIRQTSDLQRVFSYSARGALALRGTPAQIALAEWLFRELNQPVSPPVRRTAAYDQPAPSGRSDVARLFFFAHNETPQDLGEIMQMIRTTADIQAIASYPQRRAIALRGTATQVALAEWLVGHLGMAANQQIPPK
jgi:hypothetical protein